MEEPKPATNSPTGRVMDIATPKDDAPAAAVTPAPEAVAAPAPAQEAAGAPEVPAPAPAEPAAKTPAEPTPAASPTPDETPASEQPSHDNTEHEQPKSKPAHKAPVIAVLVAMVICLALTGLVVFTYFKSKNAKKVDTTTSSNSKTTVEKPQASPADIDQTSNDIDQALSSVDDAADFSASALSDQALGL